MQISDSAFKQLANDYLDNFSTLKGIITDKDYNKDFGSDTTIVGNFPIIWFGDLARYFNNPDKIKIVTMGINPSNAEFNQPSFKALSEIDLSKTDSQAKIAKIEDAIFNSFNTYFKKSKPTKYFSNLETVLTTVFAPFLKTQSLSFRRNQIIQIDTFSALATYPLWTKLEEEVQYILAFGNKTSDKLPSLKLKLPTHSGRELSARLYHLLEPDLTIYMGKYKNFKNDVEPQFINEFKKPDEKILNLVEPSKKVAITIIKETNKVAHCIVFIRNGQSPVMWAKSAKDFLYDGSNIETIAQFLADVQIKEV
ncbi:hypothetical protein [Levilactobacillus mulengensis]|uniref:hypothetical protein n=1 Tax=Levilactobacillus mulengensis TaxID=2486025 RepID=UPI000F7BA7CB|nr:hypothetical protein [Levilactobacillus mulengensis]